MTERERLIEILNKKIYPREGADPAEVVADYLLDNGVIVPPCKVGDTVYRLNDCAVSEYSWDIVSVQDWGDELSFIDDSDNSFSESDIGKTVFLSREEAEKAKEREIK